MRNKTLTGSSTITDVKIAVATVALLGALEFSLIAAPVEAQKLILKQGDSCIAQITTTARPCLRRNRTKGYREFRYSCPSGKKYRLNTACTTAESIQKRINLACSKAKQCKAPAQAPAPAPVVAPASSDITLSGIQVVSSTLILTITNQGNAPFEALDSGLEFRLTGNNNEVLRYDLVALPALAAQESTVLHLPVQLEPYPKTLEVNLDPQNLGNETRLVSAITDNNRYAGPLLTSPTVTWAVDAPSGATAPGLDQVVAKLIISNPAHDGLPLQIHALNFDLLSDIHLAPESHRFLNLYKDSVVTVPLVHTTWETERTRQEFRSQNGPYFEIQPGASETIFVTIDTQDATPGNHVSTRLAPLNGIYWSKEDSWHATHLNSPLLMFKTFTY